MRIAILAEGPNLESLLSPRFGDSPYLLFVDMETMAFEAVAVPVPKSGAGAGSPQGEMAVMMPAAKERIELAASREIKVVITGRAGPVLENLARARNIELVTEQTGTVREAVERYRSARLRRIGAQTPPEYKKGGNLANSLAIEVKGLTKHYGSILAVDHISFEVKKGEFFGFLGPNGAGKTTTVRMLTGIIKKNEGEARVMGYPAGSLPVKQLSGVMPELSNAYLDLTGWGNLMLMAGLYRVPANEAKKRAESLLQELGLLERKDSKAQTYSQGMRKRLVLCMCLLSDPEILFLDEPTSGLDVQSTRFIRSLLRGLKEEGKTIFFTTHNMDEAAEMCDRVAIINRGRLVAIDTPQNLSITAGRIYLIDVSFSKPVSSETLLKIPGVNRVEQAEAIEEAERMRMQAAMMQMRPGMGPGGGMGPPPDMMRRMQRMMQESGGPSPEMQKMMREKMKAQAAGKEAAAGTGAEMPNKLPDAGEAEKAENHRVRLYTEDTTKLMTSLVDFSRANSLQMKILNVRAPSLEDAFVRLTEEVSREK